MALSPPRRRDTLALVIYAKNKTRVSAFYQAVAGLAVLDSQPSFDLLAGPVGEVVVHAMPRALAAQVRIGRPPVPREDAAIKPVLPVADLEAIRAAARTAGGGLAPANAAWVWRGRLHLTGWDPEGNIVQFTQRVKRSVKGS